MRKNKLRTPQNIKIEKSKTLIKNLGSKKTFGPIVSLYFPSLIDRDTHQQWHSLYSIEKRDTAESNLPKERKEKILALLDEIDKYFKKIEEVEYNKTLILFISEDFYYVLIVPQILELCIVIANNPFLNPLKEISDVQNILILAIDREEAFIATLGAGKFEQLLFSSRDHVPQKIKGGSESWKGLKEKRVLRHIEWHLDEHLKKANNNLVHILKQRDDISGIYIGGHKEIVPKFEKKLPATVKKMIKGRFVSEPDLFIEEVKAKGLDAVLKNLY